MSRVLILVAAVLVIPSLVVSCGGDEKETSTAGVVNIPLDEGANGELGGGPVEQETLNDPEGDSSGSSQVNTPPASVTEGSGNPTPASAPMSALAGLDAWHRQLEPERSQFLGSGATLADQLAGFAGIFTGKADSYRASLRNTPDSSFGADFQRYAEAWAGGGTSELEKALDSGPVGTAKLVWTDALAELCLGTDGYENAGQSLATVMSDMLTSGYSRERVLELKDKVDLVGRNAAAFLPWQEYSVGGGESYWVICRKFQKQGIIAPRGWIKEFNHKSSYSLRADETLKIPTATLELKAWRSSRLMVLYADKVPIRLYSVSMGLKAKPTPLGTFTFGTELLENPVYYPAGKTPVPYGNPDNPLGDRWMGFKEDRQYGVHGTNSENTIGSFESGGCIRMHNADAKELFELVAAGVKITIFA